MRIREPRPERDHTSTPRGETAVAVVVPALDAVRELERVLPAILASGGDVELVVVDAGSRDGTGRRAAELGARVVSLDGPVGPSRARNEGAAEVNADVVLFVDADCVPRHDVVARVRAAFAADPSLVSLTGCYTVDAPEQDFFSQYMNLRHHHTHQRARREDATFWTGCGAVRRSAFLAVGGFDDTRFPNGMEDMELGLRLAARGATRLDPDIQVTHLKRWTLRSVVDADIRRRAVPWSRLILERGHLPNDLNLRTSQRLATIAAPLALASLVALPVALLLGAWGWALAALAPVFLSVALNQSMLRLFAARRGPRFAAAGWLFHQCHLVYAAATLAFCALRRPWAAAAEAS